ncbi:uncharacterized protein lins1 [Echeneis naucrates]|uniref:uncharacterized protein lins1 n=1 Tax=Echeneis naucrates TaxID=173247 RepID=UPI001113A8DD|nr:uncharacterized protein LOC115040926 [Echeneis naucrates]XP_029353934.1 uncharacterized protein LOC115040926 [Echeneis naucrates]
MEHTASCRLAAERFHGLTDAYRCFLAGSCPRRSAADAAGLILSGVRGPMPAESGECCRELGVELSCCSLTLVQQMSCRPTQAPAYWTQVLMLLFEHMDLMAVLVHHFNHEEQVVCHLAAKTVSTNVVYHLHKCGAVSPIWQQKCVEAFNSSVSGPELDSCLWSLTDVLKQLLKEAHQEILQRLLAAFDSSLCTLCSNFLPEQRKEAAQGLVGFTQGRPRGTTFCLFLDLLEALTASTLMCDTGLKSQRLTYLHSSALLTTVSCSPEYFVKKRVLLLLKRAVLQKADASERVRVKKQTV